MRDKKKRQAFARILHTLKSCKEGTAYGTLTYNSPQPSGSRAHYPWSDTPSKRYKEHCYVCYASMNASALQITRSHEIYWVMFLAFNRFLRRDRMARLDYKNVKDVLRKWSPRAIQPEKFTGHVITSRQYSPVLKSANLIPSDHKHHLLRDAGIRELHLCYRDRASSSAWRYCLRARFSLHVCRHHDILWRYHLLETCRDHY